MYTTLEKIPGKNTPVFQVGNFCDETTILPAQNRTN